MTYNLINTWFRSGLLLFAMFLFSACTGWLQPSVTKPSPEPQAVLAILRQYPGGIITSDQEDTSGADTAIDIIFDVQTTPEAAIAYYDPLLKGIGLERNPNKRSIGGQPADQAWSGGCPWHYVAIATMANTLAIHYGYGGCR